MYVAKYFAETRVEILHQLMRENPLATLVTITENGLTANHIPFEIAPDPAPFGTLRGHIARANPLWHDHADEAAAAADADADALVIFHGPDAYISPSLYATKQTTGKVVPTWNYAVVHAHGRLRVKKDPAWLRQLVENLTTGNEAGRAQPWQVTDAPDDFIAQQLDAIIGIEIPIARLLGKYKASQNRPPADQQSVIEGLKQENAAMAKLVRSARRE